MVYTFAQLEQLWRQAGGPAKLEATMAAIGLAESAGNPRAVHVNADGSIDRGLWQENSSHGYGTRSFNPRASAQEAVAIEGSQGLDAWSTYTSGAYLRFMPKRTRGGGAAGKPSRPRSLGVLSSRNFAGVDQGVDFTGKGPIPALAAGRVTAVRHESIIEGGSYPVVAYELLEGPYKGHHVYVSENFAPSVRTGQHLKAGETLGHAAGRFPYIEYGFASDAQGTPAAPLYPNPHGAKPQGTAMWAYIQSLLGGGGLTPSLPGAPAPPVGKPQPGTTAPRDHGPSGSASPGLLAAAAGAGDQALVDSWHANVAGGVFGAFSDVADFLKAALWLINPLNWLRLFELLAGAALMLLGFLGLGVLLVARSEVVQEGADFARLAPGPLGGAGRALSTAGNLRSRSLRRAHVAERVPQRIAERAATQQGEREERRSQRSKAIAQARASGRRRQQAARTRQSADRFGEVPF